MTQRTFFLDEKATKLLVKDAAEQVMNQLILDRNIRLDEKQIKSLAEATAPHIGVDIDYKRIISNVIEDTPLLNDPDNLLTPNIRTDLIEHLKMFIPDPVHGINGKKGENGKDGQHGLNGEDGQNGKNGKNYKLTKKDRADIAEDTLKGEKVVDLIIDQVMARNEIVSKERFTRKLRELKRLIDSIEKSGRKGINAGISGRDMVAEINKELGDAVWQGGGGGVSDLTYDEVIKTVDSDALLTDMQKAIRYDNGINDRTYTVKDNAVIANPKKSWVEIYRTGSGELSIVRGSNVIFEGEFGDIDFKIAGTTGNSVFLRQRLINIWVIMGSIKAF